MSINIESPYEWALASKEIIKNLNINTRQLKCDFENVFFPWDIEYNTLKIYHSYTISIQPLIIFGPEDTRELEKILDYIYEKDLSVTICSGRHSNAPISPQVLVDISLFKDIHLDKDKLIVGAGFTQGQANDFLFRHSGTQYYSHFGKFSRENLINTGSAASVGISGISCVGGIGVLNRTYGLTVDSILNFKITIPPTSDSSSKTIQANKNENNDLFWGLLGGGANNFGIVSEITYKLLEVPKIINYSYFVNRDKFREVINEWKDTSVFRPYNFSEELDLYSTGETGAKEIGLSIVGNYVIPCGETVDQSRICIKSQFQTLLNIGGILKMNNPVEYNQLYMNLVDNRIFNNYQVMQAMFKKDINVDSLIRCIDKANEINVNCSIALELMGGSIKDVNPDETAFHFRNSNFFVVIVGSCNQLINVQYMNEWEKDTVNDLGKENLYLGFPNIYGKVDNQIYYGDNYSRLQTIKNKYDPLNILSTYGTI